MLTRLPFDLHENRVSPYGETNTFFINATNYAHISNHIQRHIDRSLPDYIRLPDPSSLMDDLQEENCSETNYEVRAEWPLAQARFDHNRYIIVVASSAWRQKLNVG